MKADAVFFIALSAKNTLRVSLNVFFSIFSDEEFLGEKNAWQ